MNATQSKQLTTGQEGVLAMYDKEIAYCKRDRDAAIAADNYQEYRYQIDQLETLETERARVLAQFMAVR